MSFSYGGPAASPVSAVRFTIGDVVESRAQLSDEEIAYLLDESHGNVRGASILACEAVLSRLSYLCDQSVGGVSKSWSQLRDGWKATLAVIKNRGALTAGAPMAGGLYRSRDKLEQHNRDLKRPEFTRRQFSRAHDYLGSVVDPRDAQDELLEP